MRVTHRVSFTPKNIFGKFRIYIRKFLIIDIDMLLLTC